MASGHDVSRGASRQALRWKEVRELSRHRTLAFIRQPEAVFWVFAFPMVLAAVLGFAFQSGEPAKSHIALLEGAHANRLLERLTADERVELTRFPDVAAAERALRSGKVDLFLTDPAASPPALRLDPVRAEAESARLRVLVALGELDEDALALDTVEEKGSRYVDFLFPGLLGMNLMGTGLWAIGFAIAELRQRKILKRLLVTPMRKSSFLASFLVSRLFFLVLELVLLTAFGFWVLDVPLRGSIVLFALVSLLGATAFAGLGLLCASRVKTIEGVSGMLNLVMMPMWLGSGVFFSYERFPDAVQPLLRALPLTALNDALRELMLDGSGVRDILPEVLVLALWLVVPFVVALRVFRWS
ncbi:MAG: ABC transporter permease [bacterium]|nr:ABC transporter permease [bacterium]